MTADERKRRQDRWKWDELNAGRVVEWASGDRVRPLCIPQGCPSTGVVALGRRHRWQRAVSSPGDPDRYVCRRCGCVRLRLGGVLRYVCCPDIDELRAKEAARAGTDG